MSDNLSSHILFSRKLKTGPMSRKSKKELTPPNIRLVLPLNLSLKKKTIINCVKRKYFPTHGIVSEEEYMKMKPRILRKPKEPEGLFDPDKELELLKRHMDYFINDQHDEEYLRTRRIKREYYQKLDDYDKSLTEHSKWERKKFVLLSKEPRFDVAKPDEGATEKEVKEYEERKLIFDEQKEFYESKIKKCKDEEGMFKVFKTKKGCEDNDNNKQRGFSYEELFEKVLTLYENIYSKEEGCYQRSLINGEKIKFYEEKIKKVEFDKLRLISIKKIEDPLLKELDTPIYLVSFEKLY